MSPIAAREKRTEQLNGSLKERHGSMHDAIDGHLPSKLSSNISRIIPKNSSYTMKRSAGKVCLEGEHTRRQQVDHGLCKAKPRIDTHL